MASRRRFIGGTPVEPYADTAIGYYEPQSNTLRGTYTDEDETKKPNKPPSRNVRMGGHANLLRVPRVSRVEIKKGMQYGMLYDGVHEQAPNVPMQIRSSLAQQLLVFRWQISHYISSIRPFGMRPDHPTAHVATILPSTRGVAANVNVPKPQTGPRPDFKSVAMARSAASKGGMGTMRRFTKALRPIPANTTPPETYN